MKKVIAFFVIIVAFRTTSAQVSSVQDTVNKNSTFQVGLGFYSGVNHILSNPSDYDYNNIPGYDLGLFSKLIFNLNSRFSLQGDLRYFWRSGTINYNRSVSPHVFLIKTNGFQIPVLLEYKIRRKGNTIFCVSTGLSYNMLFYNTSYDNSSDPRFPSTSPITVINHSSTLSKASGILGLSKTFPFGKKVDFCVFSEVDMQLNKTNINELAPSYNPVSEIKYFSPICMRLGCYLIF